ncbi:MAG TPA: glycosyltransferase family 2 protein, partial [Mizugakiibacter sp.]
MRKDDSGPNSGAVVVAPGTQRPYLTVRVKFLIAVMAALLWTSASVWLSLPWLRELSALLPMWLAVVLIAFIAYLPGFMNSFLMATMALDRRPARRAPTRYPGVSVLVACYNEEANIADTLYSLARQDYPGEMEVVVVDDGSRDRSADIAREACARHSGPGRRFRLIEHGRNGGKSRALNRALAESTELLVITVDGDSWARAGAVRKLVERFLGDPEGTVAVAGAVLARNSRVNWLTRAQEWDYFHGIAAVKRMQSMYHGTLVAQGAFSL